MKLNQHYLKFSGELFDNKPIIWPINLNNVDLISIASANFVKYNQLLGDEYSITDLEVDIIQIDKKDFKNVAKPILKNDKNFKKSLSKLISNGKNHKIIDKSTELFKRFSQRKFFTGKKIIVNLNSKENNLINDWTYALHIRRNNLIKNDNYISNKEPLKFAVSINLQGEKLSENNFILNNSQIIDIQIEKDVEIEV